MPSFPAGTNQTQIVTATKLDESERSVVALEVIDVAGNATACDPVVATVSAEVPETFRLEQNYPNPFNPQTTIRFALPEAAHVRLVVYDVQGREMVRLVDEEMEAGTYALDWNGRSASGRMLPSGIYVYRLRAGAFTETRTMTLVK